jgi:hypothetical protein
MPPPALEMWTGFGQQAFEDYASVVEVVESVGLGEGVEVPVRHRR